MAWRNTRARHIGRYQKVTDSKLSNIPFLLFVLITNPAVAYHFLRALGHTRLARNCYLPISRHTNGQGAIRVIEGESSGTAFTFSSCHANFLTVTICFLRGTYWRQRLRGLVWNRRAGVHGERDTTA
ncbi:hypothetical protein LX32DRAFT_294714 [Colletotrichum zoysiae]|uniref:Uncharacterized protein n=1 Tax=Colletotrichum zoysiae TaxID=1216348 RepID=A0AAD9H223_9PEZI|nr:hypothetical protein LX32DRAFT_294714 [Colletotrichum zoysiae]